MIRIMMRIIGSSE